MEFSGGLKRYEQVGDAGFTFTETSVAYILQGQLDYIFNLKAFDRDQLSGSWGDP